MIVVDQRDRLARYGAERLDAARAAHGWMRAVTAAKNAEMDAAA